MDGYFAATVVDTPLEKLCETLDKEKGSWHILANTNSLSGLSLSASKASSGTVKFVGYRVKNSSSTVKYTVELNRASMPPKQ